MRAIIILLTSYLVWTCIWVVGKVVTVLASTFFPINYYSRRWLFHPQQLVFDYSFTLYRILIVFAIITLAYTGAKYAYLEAFTVLLETGGLLAGAAPSVLLLIPCTLSVIGIGLNHVRLVGDTLCLCHIFFLVGCSVDFWSECIRSLLKGLLYSILAYILE